MKVSAFIGISLDGFIARIDGTIDWLTKNDDKVSLGEDFGFGSFLSSVDLIVMGRTTFEQVITFGSWPYHDKKILVLASRPVNIPQKLLNSVEIATAPPKQLFDELSSKSVSHVYVDGGKVIQSFLSEGLINELTVTIVPILIGSGRSFSTRITKDVSLVNSKTTVYEFGAVQIKYVVGKDNPYS